MRLRVVLGAALIGAATGATLGAVAPASEPYTPSDDSVVLER
jgi:hypothetical protein